MRAVCHSDQIEESALWLPALQLYLALETI